MPIISITGSTEYWVGVRPAFIHISTTDDLSTVTTEGYLDEEESLEYSEELMALVKTSEGVVLLSVSLSNNHVSLVAPLISNL